jgi:hypothetical protein
MEDTTSEILEDAKGSKYMYSVWVISDRTIEIMIGSQGIDWFLLM